MKFTVLISCLVFVIFVSSVSASCKEYNEQCSTSEQCRTRYCRNGECINFGDAADDAAAKGNPCRRRSCPGKICVLQQVQCFRFPCPPVAQCVSSTEC